MEGSRAGSADKVCSLRNYTLKQKVKECRNASVNHERVWGIASRFRFILCRKVKF